MPLLENFDDFMSNLRYSCLDYHEQLTKLYDYDAEVVKALERSRRNLENSQRQAFYAASDAIQNRGREIFLEETRKAVKATGEFDYPPFRERLFSLAKVEGLITVGRTGDVGGRVSINMNSVAGTLSDYIEGVKFAREQLRKGAKGPPMPPDAASKVWKEKIYRVDREGKKITKLFKQKGKKRRVRKDITERYKGKYHKTIELRLSKLASLAPFWPIIEYGTKAMPKTGGTPYPQFEGTRFVERSRIKIQQLFDDYFTEYLERIIQEYRRRIDQLETYRRDISFEIRNINRILDDSFTGGTSYKETVSRIDVAVETLSNYLTEIRGVTKDYTTVAESLAVQRILTGDPTRSYVGGTRVRLINITREFERRINDYINEGYDID